MGALDFLKDAETIKVLRGDKPFRFEVSIRTSDVILLLLCLCLIAFIVSRFTK